MTPIEWTDVASFMLGVASGVVGTVLILLLVGVL